MTNLSAPRIRPQVSEENRELVLSSGQDVFFREQMFSNFGATSENLSHPRLARSRHCAESNQSRAQWRSK